MKRIILTIALIALSFPATAQTKKIGGPVGNALDLLQGQKPPILRGTDDSNVYSALMEPFKKLADFIGGDLDDAIELSTAVPNLQDGHGQQCFAALRSFGQVLDKHPIPLTLRAATDLEALRLSQIAFNNLCGNPHCTQVFADLATTVQVSAPVNFSIPIPSLHDICAKVPQIAVVAPDPSITVSPAPSQTAPAVTPAPSKP